MDIRDNMQLNVSVSTLYRYYKKANVTFKIGDTPFHNQAIESGRNSAKITGVRQRSPPEITGREDDILSRLNKLQPLESAVEEDLVRRQRNAAIPGQKTSQSHANRCYWRKKPDSVLAIHCCAKDLQRICSSIFRETYSHCPLSGKESCDCDG